MSTRRKLSQSAALLLTTVDTGRVTRGFDSRMSRIWIVCDQHATPAQTRQLDQFVADGWITQPTTSARAEVTDEGREVLNQHTNA